MVIPDTKIVPCWHVGPRNAAAANNFMDDLAGRLRYVVQLTTDGNNTYVEAVEGAFGGGVDLQHAGQDLRFHTRTGKTL